MQYAKWRSEMVARSGTSPAPNDAEACGAESRREFIPKLSERDFAFCILHSVFCIPLASRRLSSVMKPDM
jgi:hypothetical protein